MSLIATIAIFGGAAVLLPWFFDANETTALTTIAKTRNRAKSETKSAPSALSPKAVASDGASDIAAAAVLPLVEETVPKEVIDRSMRIEYREPNRLAECSATYRATWAARWSECVAARSPAPLRAELRKMLTLPEAATDDALRKQASDADLTLAGAQEALLRYSGEQAVENLLADKSGQAFLHDLLTDRKWLECWLSSGLLTKDEQGNDADYAAVGLTLLAQLYADDPRLAWNDVTRNLAVACALAFSQPFQKDRLARDNDLLSRYHFFKDSWHQGRLHESFDRLEAWDMRYVAGALWKDDSLAWLQRNLRVPVSKMGDACWSAEYRGGTVFGDTIQGPHFYTPWAEEMCFAENVHRHGGVCGSLSYTGAMSCAARGIPAIPCGQPGHCAYGYRPQPGKWLGGFGGPGGGCHLAIYGHNSAYRDMAEDAHADAAKNLLSRRHAWQAERAAEEGKAELALRAWRLATSLPCAYQSWLGRVDWALKQPAVDWKSTTSELSRTFANHPYVLFDLLRKYESLTAPTPQGELALWGDIHRQVADAWLYPTWNDLNQVLSAHVAALGNSTNAKMQVAEMILPAVKDSAKTFPAAMQWAQQVYPQDDAGRKRWIDTLSQTIGAGVAGDQAAIKKLYDQAILAAANAGARESFQLLTTQAMRQCDVAAPALPAIKPFAGEQFSAGGILRVSTTSGWDNPCLHAGVLDAGGSFHTDREVHPWAEVQLRKLIEPSGIVVVPGTSNRWRLFPLRIEVSEDGEKWHAVGEFAKEQEVCSVDLSANHRRVRYVRVSRADDRSEFFHLSAINVWGKALE